jgi:hypothetical protein
MITPTFKVVQIPERRNQQPKIVYEGTKKECVDFYEKIIVEKKLNFFFVGQYIDDVLNKIIKTNKIN